MRKIPSIIVDLISYFFVLLFIYAGMSKMMDFENFQVQIGQSPLLSAYAGFVSYAVIAAELLISGLLLNQRTRLAGLYASFTLMVAFTVYIYLILNYSDFVPCSCGGILEKMGWTEHLIFNIGCVVLAATGVQVLEKDHAAGLRRPILKMAAVFLLGSGGMIALFFSSEHLIERENNFTRRYPHHPIVEDKSYDLKVNSYYFAGSEAGSIYLGNPTSPFRILKMDSLFKKPDTIDVVPSTDRDFRHLRYLVQNSMLFAYDGMVPVIYAAPIDSLQHPLREISSDQAYFDQFVVLSPTQFMLRVEEKTSQRTGLATLTLGEKYRVQINSSVLTAKADGGFDADGQLLYDTAEGYAYYLFYYRNQILKLNSSLKVVSRMKTIDTVSTARIKVKNLQDGRKKMTEPPLRVNRYMAVHKGLLFSASNLIGRHESKELWKKNTVVDVYTTAPAGYWGSMYVQNRDKNKMSRMFITDQYFYVLSGDVIVRYRCAQALTDHFINGRSRKPGSE
ncbi:DoxX family protein [Chryseobacterium sp.]|uniref:DoxX family protein n=1 Tax=Chryseobacterium sp. TaxID=1871047 RepID=UPI0011CB562A|nr:DoxX family protein [Chryseobacterium sp.]TXF78850.1 DoxX family protein [Chryseobacterium sp.]